MKHQKKVVSPAVIAIAIVITLAVIAVPFWYFLNREPPAHPRTNTPAPPEAGMSWDPARGGVPGLPVGDPSKRPAILIAPPPDVFGGDPMRGGMPAR